MTKRTSLPTILLIAAISYGQCSAQERTFVSNARLSLGTESNRSASVRSADVDGDGIVDLLVANGRHWPQANYVFLNQGRSRFNVMRPLGSDRSTTYACEPADFDGDGDVDIAVGNDHGPCRIMLNDGAGQFSAGQEFGEPSSVRSLTTADIDHDGDVDILVTCRGRPNRIHFNDGAGGFSKVQEFGSSNDSTIDVAVADVNQDGFADLLLANRDGQPNTIGPSWKFLGQWAYANGVTLDFSRPEKPTDNALIESFNGSVRAECLNRNWFLSLGRRQGEDRSLAS